MDMTSRMTLSTIDHVYTRVFVDSAARDVIVAFARVMGELRTIAMHVLTHAVVALLLLNRVQAALNAPNRLLKRTQILCKCLATPPLSTQSAADLAGQRRARRRRQC